MGVDLGGELQPSESDSRELSIKLQTDSTETQALLREVRMVLAQLPARIEEAVQRTLTAQNLARTTRVHVDAPDMSGLEDLIARMPAPPTALEIRDAVASIPTPPARKVKRVVNRDAFGRIESVTEAEE